jgi:hypothetical protein
VCELNLLLKDLCAITAIGKILLKIKEIIKNFKNSHIIHTRFKKNKIKSMVKLQYQHYNYLVTLEAFKETSIAVGLKIIIDKKVKQYILYDLLHCFQFSLFF